MMRPRFSSMARRLAKLGLAFGLIALATAAWVFYGEWPGPKQEELPWRPDAIVVLGGGEAPRWSEALRLHYAFPNAPIVVTGDDGDIYNWLLQMEVPPELLIHEQAATSTYENATLTAPLLERCNAQKVVLVTEWFHSPRARAVFAAVQPKRQFVVSFEPRPASSLPHEIFARRRERVAALVYLFYGVNSFR
jgi:uncharacterized SAM-binding protein YcdF (DUF218 family)